VSKPCQDRFLHPILVQRKEKRENTGIKMWHTKKIFKKRKLKAYGCDNRDLRI